MADGIKGCAISSSQWDIVVVKLTPALATSKISTPFCKFFSLEMLKFAILAVLTIPSIFATLSRKMASALIAANDTERLKKTFKTFEGEQYERELVMALADITKVQAHIPKVATCLRVAHDPFPEDKMCVSYLVHSTFDKISPMTNTDAASFTNLITSFKPSDIKPLVAIRYTILERNDVVYVLKRVMDKSPELIIDDLPNWLASHRFDRNSKFYPLSLREEAFQYLISFATQSVLEKTLTILKGNEHYKVDSTVVCCDSQNHIPQDLANRIEALLEFVRARKTLREVLTFLPKALVDLTLEYTTCDIPPKFSNSSPVTTARSKCLIS